MNTNQLIEGMQEALVPFVTVALAIFTLFLLIDGIRDEQTAKFNIRIGQKSSGYNSNDLKTNSNGTVTFSPVVGFWKNPITVRTQDCIIITRGISL